MNQSLDFELTPREIEILFALVFDPAPEEEFAPVNLITVPANPDLTYSAALQ